MRFVLGWCSFLLGAISSATAQPLWTHIFVDSNSQVDLWTQTGSGCECSFDKSRVDCACCVLEGGCHCGLEAPHRCAQCGIHQHCTFMCNMTFDGGELVAKSGKGFGQIKSPSIQGPGLCWYSFIPNMNQRVEIQIYRLISVGRFNGSSCESGFVQLVSGVEPVMSEESILVCGANERFTPPVLLFGDNGPSTLIVRMDEATVRSQIMAYYSFTTITTAPGPGFRPSGGSRIDNTECDWRYEEEGCRREGDCYLGSPGYPGVYRPHTRCCYHLHLHSPAAIRLDFKFVYLPHSHCDTDFIKVYNGSSATDSPLATLCSNRRQTILSKGTSLLVEFRSGSTVHPFDYNGFVASVFYVNITEPTVRTTELVLPTEKPPSSANTENGAGMKDQTDSCTLTFFGNESRSGHFDTRSHQWRYNCSFIFFGRQNDILHLTFLNYHLRAPSCQTIIEVYNGLTEMNGKTTLPIKQICSPIKKHTRDTSGGVQFQDVFVSSGNVMSFILKRSHTTQHIESEFVDGAFLFHDERVDGTLQPETACDVDFFGVTSRSSGQIRNPSLQHLFFNSPSPFRCVQRFVPGVNQSITLKIVSLKKLPLDDKCETACGDGGCWCFPVNGNLHSVNHLILSTKEQALSCLCGDFQQEWLPVGIRSWSATNIIYSVAHSHWNKGFDFEANYVFHTDQICGHHVLNQHSGQIVSPKLNESSLLNYYFYQSCTWVLDSNVERQLTVVIESDQNRPCASWNITIHEYNEINPEKTGALLYTFCARNRHKTYALPWKLNIIVIRLNAMTHLLPSFSFRWKSQILRSNTRLAGVTPAQSSSSLLQPLSLSLTLLALHLNN